MRPFRELRRALDQHLGRIAARTDASGEPNAQYRAQLIELAALDTEEVAKRLNCGLLGLTDGDAEQRLLRFGPNSIAQEVERGIPMQVLLKLRNPLNILLLTLSVVSLATGNIESATIISLMVVVSVSLALFQERRSSRAAADLRAMVHTTATVIRPRQRGPGARVPGDPARATRARRRHSSVGRRHGAGGCPVALGEGSVRQSGGVDRRSDAGVEVPARRAGGDRLPAIAQYVLHGNERVQRDGDGARDSHRSARRLWRDRQRHRRRARDRRASIGASRVSPG